MYERLKRDLESTVVALDELSEWTAKWLYEKERKVFLDLYVYAVKQWPEINGVLQVNFTMKNRYLVKVVSRMITIDDTELKNQFRLSAKIDELLIQSASTCAKTDERHDSILGLYINAIRNARKEREESLRYLHQKWTMIAAVQRDLALSEIGVERPIDTRNALTRLKATVRNDLETLRRFKQMCESPTEVPDAPSLAQLLLPR